MLDIIGVVLLVAIFAMGPAFEIYYNYVSPAIARRRIEKIKNELFIKRLHHMAANGICITPEK